VSAEKRAEVWASSVSDERTFFGEGTSRAYIIRRIHSRSDKGRQTERRGATITFLSNNNNFRGG
jgi:hypothetical protein